jgi:hypothetical protein
VLISRSVAQRGRPAHRPAEEFMQLLKGINCSFYDPFGSRLQICGPAPKA